jgi:hypothetical protein
MVLATALVLNSCVDETDLSNDREDFLGFWTCNEFEGDFAPQTYTIEIYASGSGNDVRIEGLYNQGNNFIVSGEVSGQTLFIDQQTVDGITLSGSGTMKSTLDEFSLNFTANDGSGNDNVKARCIR